MLASPSRSPRSGVPRVRAPEQLSFEQYLLGYDRAWSTLRFGSKPMTFTLALENTVSSKLFGTTHCQWVVDDDQWAIGHHRPSAFLTQAFGCYHHTLGEAGVATERKNGTLLDSGSNRQECKREGNRA